MCQYMVCKHIFQEDSLSGISHVVQNVIDVVLSIQLRQLPQMNFWWSLFQKVKTGSANFALSFWTVQLQLYFNTNIYLFLFLKNHRNCKKITIRCGFALMVGNFEHVPYHKEGYFHTNLGASGNSSSAKNGIIKYLGVCMASNQFKFRTNFNSR